MERSHRLRDIRSLSEQEITDLVKELGQPAFRAKQICEWLFAKQAGSFDEMTNIPKKLREQLAERFAFATPTEAAKQVSHDGSRKYLLEFSDGTSVETVGMPSRGKLSVCVSTQAGCAMGCAFCATGMGGLKCSLTAREIVDQVIHVAHDFDERVTSVVFMGQGEPFVNMDATIEALRMLNDPNGMAIGARHLTVSTCGVIPGIKRFAELPEQFTLAISLHSAIQSTRNKLMPGVKKYTLPRLHEAIQAYVEKTGRRPTYEFAMIDGVNDTPEHARMLAENIRKIGGHVNLIPLNHVDERRFEPSKPENMKKFIDILQKSGVNVTVRRKLGGDVDASCGQLRRKMAHSES